MEVKAEICTELKQFQEKNRIAAEQEKQRKLKEEQERKEKELREISLNTSMDQVVK